jgi:hypothetical protein
MFYPSIVERWAPVIKRLKLPFEKVSDFMDSCIQSISWPSLSLENVRQQQSQFDINYKGGKELEPIFDKTIEVTFKLSESYISYWILFENIQEFMRYKDGDVFWPSMFISFLDLQGFELVIFEIKQLIPISLGQFSLSYATTAAEYNNFTLGMKYNRFNITRRLDQNNYTVGKNQINGLTF